MLAVDNLMYGEQNLYHLCADEAFEFSYGDARAEGLMRRLVRGDSVGACVR